MDDTTETTDPLVERMVEWSENNEKSADGDADIDAMVEGIYQESQQKNDLNGFFVVYSVSDEGDVMLHRAHENAEQSDIIREACQSSAPDDIQYKVEYVPIES